MSRYILVVETDSHGGHKLGLLSPELELQGEGPNGELTIERVRLTEYQEWLWKDVYMPGVEQARGLATSRKTTSTIVMHLGDICHGDKHPDQLVSTRLSDQIAIALANLKPLLELPKLKALRLVMGTGAHEFGEGSAAILVGERVRAGTGLDVQTLYHGLSTICGLSVDYAHHGPGAGGRSWLGGNVARYYLRDQMYKSVMGGEDPADLYLRGHVHAPVDEVVRVGKHVGRLVICPSMCGLGDYGQQATKSEWQICNGFMAFVIENGKIVDTLDLTQTIDIRMREEL